MTGKSGERQAEGLSVYLLSAFRLGAISAPEFGAEHLRLRKARHLFALLAITPGHRLHREQVMETLWPDVDPHAAANRLYYTLHIARNALEPFGFDPLRLLVFEDGLLQLCPDFPLWIDVEAFESAAARARQGQNPALHQAALALYTGDLLPEDLYEDWTSQPREALRRESLELALDLGKLYEARQEFEAAIAAFQQVFAQDPAHEGAHVGLMRVYALSGQRQQALRQYQRLQEALRSELEAEPDPQSTRLYNAIVTGQFPAPGEEAETLPFQAAAAAGETPRRQPRQPRLAQQQTPPAHNLPLQLTSFIGRQEEIAEVTQLVGEHRLVTLTGSGGAGKTRLGLEVGRGVFQAFLDGVWFVDLTALTDPALIPGAVLAALDLRTSLGMNAAKQEVDLLVQSLQAKSLLLILDNCEHLVEACARLAEALLRACPNLHILATSREALNADGEQAYRVPNLDLPDPKHLPSLLEFSQVEAVQLFVERARSADRDFVLVEQDAQAVAQICSRLDGIPLAIELAAARVKVMTPAQIAERMQDAFHLLSSGSRTALPRHQTLRAAIDWSYNLLNEQEKAFFRRLAVFSGGWNLEAAEAVCAGGGIEPFEVLDLLSRLVEKSLVLKEEKDGQARFHMLETIRQCASSQLYAGEREGKEAKDRHRDWFLSLAEKAMPLLRTREQIAWLDRLELDHDNLRAALHWSLDQKHIEQALRLAWALDLFWNMHSHYQEAYRWTQRALDLAETDRVIRQSCWWARCMIGYFDPVLNTGADIAAIVPLMEEACQICLRQDDLLVAGEALNELGVAEANLGHWETAERYFREGLEIVKQFEGNSLYSYLLLCLGIAVAARGDYAASRDCYLKSLGMHKLHGDRRITLYTMLFFAEDLFLQGQVKAALELCLQAVDHAEALGTRHEMLRFLENLAKITLMQGHFVQAREWAWKVFQLEAELGGKGKGTLVTLAVIDLNENQLEAARGKILEVLDLARPENELYGLFNKRFKAYMNMGRVELKRADPVSARKYLDEAQNLYPAIVGIMDGEKYLLNQTLAHTARLESRRPEARQLYGTNLRQMLNAQHYLYVPESLEGLAMLELEEGRSPSAARLFGTAQALRERMGTPLPPSLQGEHAAYQARLHQALQQEELERLWNEGRAMSLEEAIGFTQLMKNL